MDNKRIRQSWINNLSSKIDQFPGNNFIYYLSLAILLVLIQSLITWIEGAQPWGNVLPPHLFLSAAIAFILGIIPYFEWLIVIHRKGWVIDEQQDSYKRGRS